MKNFSTGSGGELTSPFTSTGTTGPTIPASKTLISGKRNIDPASSYIPHNCPVPSSFETKRRKSNLS